MSGSRAGQLFYDDGRLTIVLGGETFSLLEKSTGEVLADGDLEKVAGIVAAIRGGEDLR